MMRRLKGDDITPRTSDDAKKLIGKSVMYLRKVDIDKSGRGYFFPKYNVVTDVVRRQIIFEDFDSAYISDIVEMVEIET